MGRYGEQKSENSKKAAHARIHGGDRLRAQPLADGNTVRQVVFLTDERPRIDVIVSNNCCSLPMQPTRAAELGRGTFTHIGSVEQVESRMRELFGKLESTAVFGLLTVLNDPTPGAALTMTKNQCYQ